MNVLSNNIKKDSYFNKSARPQIAGYYDLEGAVSGSAIKADWEVSLRFSFTYAIPDNKIIIKGGAGIFSGIFECMGFAIFTANVGYLNIPLNYTDYILMRPLTINRIFNH